MARLERITTTRYLLNGKHCPKGTAGAQKVRRKTRHWYGVGVPGQPKTRRVKLSTDKAVARRMLDDLVRGHERGRAGLPDDAAAAKPLLEHLADYAEAVALGLAGGRSRRAPSADHAKIASRYPATVLADALGYTHLGDLSAATPTAVAKLLRLRASLPKSEGGWSNQTCNNHLAGCKRFVRWLASKRVPVAADLLDGVPAMDAANHRTRHRRECTAAELGRLLLAARAGATSYGLTGEHRYHLYVTAFGTGFRISELSRLAVGQFDLGASPPCLTIQGRGAKNRKTVRQPLPPDVAAELRPWLAGRPDAESVWPAGSWKDNGAQLLAVDLEAAGVAYRTDTPDGPTYLDFHALRHTYVTALMHAGVGPKELQELARHGDPRQTLGVYAHSRAEALSDAVGRIGLPGAAPAATPPTYAELAATVAELRAQLRPPNVPERP